MKGTFVIIRTTYAEKAELKHLAQQRGLSLSSFLREAAKNAPVAQPAKPSATEATVTNA